MEIRTDRLRLRYFRADDLDRFHEMFGDPVAMRFGATLPHEDLEVTRQWLDRRIAVPASVGEDLVMEYESQAIGKVGMPVFPEIGFIVHRSFWGRGFAREAVAATLDRAFDVHGLAAVTATVDPQNQPSLRLLASLRFMETGRRQRTLQLGNEWRDSVYLRLTAQEWNAARESRAG